MTKNQRTKDLVTRPSLALRSLLLLLTGVFILACSVSNTPPAYSPSQPPPVTAGILQSTDTLIPSVPPVIVDTATTAPVILPTDTPLPPAPTAAQSCSSAFSCSDPSLPPLVLAAGGPNDPTFTPCEFSRAGAWIDAPAPYIIELGERRYFFACDFPSPPVSAVINLSDGSTQSAQLISSIPNPDLRIGNAVAIVDWPSLPNQPTGLYTLTISSGDGTQAQLQFQVNPPTTEHILTVPASGPPGTTFTVYYVNFDLNTSPIFYFYGEEQPTVGGDHTLPFLGSWQVTITEPLASVPGKGWAQLPLSSASTDRPAAYSITYDNWRIYNLFWLH